MKFFLSPVVGQVVDVGACWPGGVALLRVDLGFGPSGEKKVKIFLSPVAGQVVDVGTSWAGGAALLRVDLAFGPIGEKKMKILPSPVAGQAHTNEQIHLGSRPGKGAKSGPDTQRNLD